MKKGFTLIELLVVISIIGILSVLVISNNGTIHTEAIRMGPRKVITMKDFFFTLVRYSLRMISLILLIFRCVYGGDEDVVHGRKDLPEAVDFHVRQDSLEKLVRAFRSRDGEGARPYLEQQLHADRDGRVLPAHRR